MSAAKYDSKWEGVPEVVSSWMERNQEVIEKAIQKERVTSNLEKIANDEWLDKTEWTQWR